MSPNWTAYAAEIDELWRSGERARRAYADHLDEITPTTKPRLCSCGNTITEPRRMTCAECRHLAAQANKERRRQRDAARYQAKKAEENA